MNNKPFFFGRMPLPPGINHSYQIVHIGGKARLAGTPRMHQFKEAAHYELTQAKINWQIVEECRNHQHTPLLASLNFYYPTLWSTDIDAGIKAALDAVFQHLALNDNLITALTATKQADHNDPRVEVVLYRQDGITDGCSAHQTQCKAIR